MKKLRITIGDKSYDVTVEVLGEQAAPHPMMPSPPSPGPAAPAPAPAPARAASPAPAETAGSNAVCSPMAGLVKEVQVKVGDVVSASQALVVLEAMKMNNQVVSPRPGTVKEVRVQPGESVPEGHVLLIVE